jgi:hypothetical protein
MSYRKPNVSRRTPVVPPTSSLERAPSGWRVVALSTFEVRKAPLQPSMKP